jgi:hypothetical protein
LILGQSKELALDDSCFGRLPLTVIQAIVRVIFEEELRIEAVQRFEE